MTVRDFLTDLNNSLKGVSLDSYVPNKWLYLKSQGIIADFLKKDVSSNLQLFKQSKGWAELECIEMIEVAVTSCDIPVYLCQKLLRSKEKLPDIYDVKSGVLARQATSLDFSNAYDNIFSPRLWVAAQKREYKAKKYFFIIDGYLYIPIPKGEQTSPKTLRMQVYPKNLKEVDEFNSKQGCGSCKPDTKVCKSVLDYEMVIPDFLINPVKTEVLNQVLQSYGKLQTDSLPNLNPNQITNR